MPRPQAITKDQTAPALPLRLSPKEAATMLGVSRRMVYDLAASCELAHDRIGRRIVFNEADLREYMQQCRTASKKQMIVGTLSLTAACRPSGESSLESFFRKLGIAPKQGPSTSQRRRAVNSNK